jgi:predicted nuclease of predicted toxin-antitoxin system
VLVWLLRRIASGNQRPWWRELLLDENLSSRLVDLLSDLYPGSDHVHNLNLGGANDSDVWDYA